MVIDEGPVEATGLVAGTPAPTVVPAEDVSICSVDATAVVPAAVVCAAVLLDLIVPNQRCSQRLRFIRTKCQRAAEPRSVVRQEAS